MSTIILCPNCEKKLKQPAVPEGKKVRCPGCGATFAPAAAEKKKPATSAPKPKLRPAPVHDDSKDLKDVDEYGIKQEPRCGPRRAGAASGRKSKSAKKGTKKPAPSKSKAPLFIGISVLCAMLVGSLVFMLARTGGDDDPAGNPVTVADGADPGNMDTAASKGNEATAGDDRGSEDASAADREVSMQQDSGKRTDNTLVPSLPKMSETMGYKPDEEPIAGVFPQPALLPGIAHWQLFPVAGDDDSVAWSPDGRFIATCHGYKSAANPQIRVFNAETLELVGVRNGRGSRLAWSSDSQSLAVGNFSQLDFWQVNGELRASVKAPFNITSVACSPDGRWLAACWRTGGRMLQDKTVRLWRLDGTPGPIFAGHTESLREVAWSPDSTWLATVGRDRTLRLWNADGNPGPVLQGHTNEINSVSWGSDSKKLVTGSDDGTLRVWDRISGKSQILYPTDIETKSRVSRVRWSHDGKWIAFGSSDGVQLIHPDGKLGPLIAGRGLHAWSPNSERIIVGRQIYSVDGRLEREIPALTLSYLSLATWSPDGLQLACVRDGDRVCLFSPTGQPRMVLQGDRKEITHLRWSPDSHWLLTVSDDKTIDVWHSDGKPGAVIEGLDQAITDVAWCPDSRSIAVSTRTPSFQLWHVDGSSGPLFSGHTKWINRVAWSPDGRWIASASADQTVRLWRADGAAGPVLTGHTAEVVDVSWSSDGQRLATAGGTDMTVRLWEATGKPGVVMKDHVRRTSPREQFGGYDGRVNCVAWSPDGRYFASGGDDHHLRVWNADGKPAGAASGFNKIPWINWSPNSQWIFPGQFGLWNPDGSLGYRFQHLGTANPAIGWSPDSGQFVYTYRDMLVCHDANSGACRWISLRLDEDSWATFNAFGELLHGDAAKVNRYFAYLVDAGNQDIEVCTVEEFHQRMSKIGRQ